MWSDGDTMWALDRSGAKLAAFDWPARTPNASRDITLHQGHDEPSGVWGHDGVLYVLHAQPGDIKMYAYQYLNNATGLTVTGRPTPGSLLSADVGEIEDPSGLASPLEPDLVWQRSVDDGQRWADIAGQTTAQYTIARSDLGALLRLRAGFVDNAGCGEVLRSAGVLAELPSVPSLGLGDPHVAAGGYHTCALLKAGGVVCRGYDEFGQVSGIPALDRSATPPETWKLLSGGEFHTCGLVSDGTVRCWGDNRFGQAPAKTTAASGKFVWVDAGAWHTCALSDEEAIECWGRNDDNQADVPDLAAGLTWLAVSAGGSVAWSEPDDDGVNNGYTCGLASDGNIACWGAYGPRTIQVRRDAFSAVRTVEVPGLGVHAAPQLSGGLFYTSVTVGGAHACATVSDGSLRCWGNGGTHLGTPQHTNESANHQSSWSQPEPPTGTQWITVAAGAHHTCATAGATGVTSQIKCWGNEIFLHHVHPTKRTHPTGRFTNDHARFPSVGSWHTCWLHNQNKDRVTCKGDTSFGTQSWNNKPL